MKSHEVAQHSVVNLYFVASPLQYLAARAIAEHFESGTRQVLVWYKRGVTAVVQHSDWDAAVYMPFHRSYPVPGPFGSLKRLLENIAMVSELVGPCAAVHIHSAVFDSEAINYFLRALPRTCGATTVKARILPDGLISTRRYPLNLYKRTLQHLRRLRRLVSPLLNFWCFSGDRIGSDAPFCDRIYVLHGLPHEYPSEKTVELPPLVTGTAGTTTEGTRALVIGQPLAAVGLLTEHDLNEITGQIAQWLRAGSFTAVDYKGHPKDQHCELYCPEFAKLALNEPLETWMAKTHYDAVVGVRSSALLFARQLYPAATKVLAFGWDKVHFKSSAERRDMAAVFASVGVELVE
jgi:hypothetical protein